MRALFRASGISIVVHGKRRKKTFQDMNFLEHSLGTSVVYKPAEVSLCAFFAKYKAKKSEKKNIMKHHRIKFYKHRRVHRPVRIFHSSTVVAVFIDKNRWKWV